MNIFYIQRIHTCSASTRNKMVDMYTRRTPYYVEGSRSKTNDYSEEHPHEWSLIMSPDKNTTIAFNNATITLKRNDGILFHKSIDANIEFDKQAVVLKYYQ